jgi:hypothetical protein
MYRLIGVGVIVAVGALFHFWNTGGLSASDQALNNWLNKYQHPDSSISYADTTKLSRQLVQPNFVTLTTLCAKGRKDFRRFEAQPLPPDPQMRAPWEGFNSAGFAEFSDCLQLETVSNKAQVRVIVTKMGNQAVLLDRSETDLDAAAKARGLNVQPVG